MLSDTEKRAAYDRFGHAGVDPNAGGFGGGQGFGGGGFADAFGDIFGDIFGGAAGGRGGRGNVYRGADLRYSMEVTLEEACATLPTAIIRPRYELDRMLAESKLPEAAAPAPGAKPENAVPPAPTSDPAPDAAAPKASE